MFLVLVALWRGWLKIEWCRSGARLLLTEMLLFFIPAVVAAVQYPDVFLSAGFRIIAVILVSTLLVMTVTALVVDRCYRFELLLRRRWRHREA